MTKKQKQQQGQKHEGWTEKALASLANQQQEPGLSRDATLPEVDALIAEKVMGWRWWTFEIQGIATPARARYLAASAMRDGDREWDGVSDVITCVDALRDVPRYSTDMNAAMLVARHITSEDDGTAVEFVLRYSPYIRKWFAQIHYLNRKGYAHVSALTAPHAICLAALEACTATALPSSEEGANG